VASLAPLLDLLPEERVGALIDARAPVTVPDAARPFLLASIARHLDRPLLAIAARTEEAEHLARDVRAFLGPEGAEVFPGWEVLPGEPVSPSVETMGRRLDVLARLRRGQTLVVIATVQGATQLVAPPTGDLDGIGLRPGVQVDLEEVSVRLVEMGYERNYIVERRGEFAIRGGILDVFPPAAERPARAELWGDEITSLRQFALASQRSLEEIDGIDLVPCRELRADEGTRARAAQLAEQIDDPMLEQLAQGIVAPGAERLLPLLTDGLVPLVSLLPPGSPVAILEPKRVRDRADEVIEQVAEWARISGLEDTHYAPLDQSLAAASSVLMLSGLTEPGSETLSIETWTQAAGKPDVLVGRVKGLIAEGYQAVVAASLPDTAQTLQRNLQDAGLSFTIDDEAPRPGATPGGSIVIAELGRGFVLPWARLVLVAESDLTGRRSGAARRRVTARRRTSGPLDLAEGDLVVHEVHGIGIYRGLVDRELLGIHREYMVIEYAKGDTLYAPSDQTDLVSKYIGGEAPKIHRLNSAEWGKTKARVRRRAREIAAELVKLYAARLNAKGTAYPMDTPWMRELEDSFPYEETPDQLRAADEVKDDMERPIPMDRLVCGDVGYGKTEIAVRAAFKAVTASKQVAVLVPTTILAQQHHATFFERFRHFPVRVEMLSRFLTQPQAKKVTADIASGKVDVVIGTHRLLSEDVKFLDLGLVIVDEEQRFGVEQKERLKQLRTAVDVLTLTATPIPRTLEMAMSGIRDMSIVDTPPENRHPVMTFVGDYDEEVVASAVRRELLRDGQVFYVYPRVETIDFAARRLQDLVPEARIGLAHGQMDERLLENAMLEFADAKTNVLVCTTIIESGLDMPTVNTLIVERSDLLGLAQMYQLRGRVGRAHERAYAYLFFPPDRSLTEPAHERLKTIAEYTGLGSGFRIAMRDLEIRGAGNLLGAEQHGHIAEVGFDLYVKLVAAAVDEAKGTPYEEDVEIRIDLPLEAYIPKSYISDENLRLEAYRKIAAIRSPEDLTEARSELMDRFGGPVPPAVENLFEVASLRRLMAGRGITEAATVASNLRIRPVELEESRQVRLQRILPGATWKPHNATLLVPERLIPKAGVVAWVSDLLQQLTSAQ
jgi:transcription-repair coupling factor (superfamily II helicase)